MVSTIECVGPTTLNLDTFAPNVSTSSGNTKSISSHDRAPLRPAFARLDIPASILQDKYGASSFAMSHSKFLASKELPAF